MMVFNSKPAKIDEFIPEYNYEHNAVLTYSVALNPNSLYEEDVLGPGRVYFTKTVKDIHMVFSYVFKGKPKDVPVSGTYGVTVTLVSGEDKAVGEGDAKSTPLWQKKFDVIPPTPFSTNGGSVDISRTFSLRPVDLQEICDKIHEELGVTTRPNNVLVEGWVNTIAAPDPKRISKRLVATLKFPLGQGYFKIEGEPLASGADSVGKTVTIIRDDILAQQRKAGMAVSILGSVTAALGVGALFQLRAKLIQRRMATSDCAVPRKFKDRIVEASVRGELPSGVTITVGSFGDLIKVADELAKPIIHYTFGQGSDTYYVPDGDINYAYMPHTKDFRRREEEETFIGFNLAAARDFED